MAWSMPISAPRATGCEATRECFGIYSLTPHHAFANMVKARSAGSWIGRVDGVA